MDNQELFNKNLYHHKSFSLKNIFGVHAECPNDTSTPLGGATLTRILILGGGFAGVQVLKKPQTEFESDTSIEITLVSKDNFSLFTPMLPEILSGRVEPTNITVPIRSFCNSQTKFYVLLAISSSFFEIEYFLILIYTV